MKMFWLIVAVLLPGFVDLAAQGNGGATGLSFLKVGVDARSAGMGEAAIAVSNDANASYWNPAGLVYASGSNATFQHNNWLLDINSEFAALQFHGKNSSLAFHVYSMNLGEIEVRSIPSLEPQEQTSAHYASAGVSYARKIKGQFAAGITAKYLYEKIFVYSAGGYAADLSLTWKNPLPDLTLAGGVYNVGSMNNFRNEASELPLLLRFGAMLERKRVFSDVDVILAGDLVMPKEEDARFHFGLEAAVKELILLRSGYAAGYDSRSVSFGVGIRKSAFRFDYAFTPVEEDLGNSQRFSVVVGL